MGEVGGRQERLRAAFFCYGWLTPVLLPLAQVGGRALFDILAYGYIAWGLLSLPGTRFSLERGPIILYLGVLVAFFLGVPTAEDGAEAFKTWLEFALRSLVLVFTLAALQQDTANLERLQRALGILGVMTLLVLYAVLGHLMQSDSFLPHAQLKEDNLPFLLPFMLVWVGRVDALPWRCTALVLLGTAVFAYVVLSEGRAALVGLVVASIVFGLTVLGWRARRVGLLALLALVLAVALNPAPFSKTVDEHSGWLHPIDAFTSGRTVVWRQALEHPPDCPLVGVGMGNVQYAEAVLTIGEERLGHLHNFIMDAWYETGLLGLAALLFLLGYGFGRPACAWPRLNRQERRQAGVFVSAALAIVSAALLSFSYTSRQVSIYLFLCLAVLLHMASRAARKS